MEFLHNFTTSYTGSKSADHGTVRHKRNSDAIGKKTKTKCAIYFSDQILREINLGELFLSDFCSAQVKFANSPKVQLSFSHKVKRISRKFN